jgi:hypothetical protein
MTETKAKAVAPPRADRMQHFRNNCAAVKLAALVILGTVEVAVSIGPWGWVGIAGVAFGGPPALQALTGAVKSRA